jgi:hypothetical protein
MLYYHTTISLTTASFPVHFAGNGRPFAMVVLDPAIIYPDQALLDSVRDAVNRGEGLNAEKDVELALLTLVSSVSSRNIFWRRWAPSQRYVSYSDARRIASAGRQCKPRPKKRGRATAVWCGWSAR